MRVTKLTFTLCVAFLCPVLSARQAQKSLTNDDVVKMVKVGLAESAVVATIQANPGNYDISPDGLIALQKAGVTENEMNVIVAVASGTAPASAAAPAPTAAAANAAVPAPTAGALGSPGASAPASGASTAPVALAAQPQAAASAADAPKPRFQMPKVSIVESGASKELPREKTQLAQTKAPASISGLAGDSVLSQSIQSGVSDATMSAASRITSSTGNSAVQQAGGIFSGAMTRRKPSVTYVWGVLGPASTNILQTTTPEFSVTFDKAPGVNPNDFEPAIVRLTPAQNTCRIVGATQAKEDQQSSNASDWQIYSSFVEERVAATAQKIAPGQYKLSPASPLYPGEYAVVLRPVSKAKKFSGGDVARGQGDGLVFDTLWSFAVSENAQ